MIFRGAPSEYESDFIYSDTTTRQYVLIHNIQENQIEAIRFFPEDALERWLSFPWEREEASKWADPATLSTLKYWHERIRSLKDFEYYSSSQPCDPNLDCWQITVNLSEKNSTQKQESVRFIITQEDEGYFIQTVSGKDIRE